MNNTCPKCKHVIVPPYGNLKSTVLLVGEFPGYEELMQGIPFVGKTGQVLHEELGRAGLPMQAQSMRMTNLWLHGKDEKACDLHWHLDQLVKEFKGKTHVLLMGSDTISAILGSKVSELSGLRITIPEFKTIRFWIAPNPAIVFHSPVGEFRLAIERFVHDVVR
jgi:uracil-DNA glycosylase